jgi:hypothetical protein
MLLIKFFTKQSKYISSLFLPFNYIMTNENIEQSSNLLDSFELVIKFDEGGHSKVEKIHVKIFDDNRVREPCFKKDILDEYDKNEVLQVILSNNNMWATINPSNVNSINVNSAAIFFGTIDEKTLVKTPKFFVNIEMKDKRYNCQYFIDIANFTKETSHGLKYNDLVRILHHIGA